MTGYTPGHGPDEPAATPPGPASASSTRPEGWHERYNKLYGDYTDMQNILAAIIDQAGGEITIHPRTLASLPRLNWIHATKTNDGGMRIAVTKVPGA